MTITPACRWPAHLHAGDHDTRMQVTITHARRCLGHSHAGDHNTRISMIITCTCIVRMMMIIIIYYLHIWVRFCRTGKMAVLCLIFKKSRRLMWPNQKILTTSVDLCWLIVSSGCWKTWIWPLLSKKTTFYCTLNLTHFSNFIVILTPSKIDKK